MSIKNKGYSIPPEDDLPPYEKNESCWGCNKLFDFAELRFDSNLCYKCHHIVKEYYR